MGQKKNTDMSQIETKVKVVEVPDESEDKTDEGKKPKVQAQRSRSAKYKALRAQVDKTKFYPADQAVELIKKLSATKFDASVEAHLEVKKAGSEYSFAFPHSTGKSITVAIVDDKVLKDIEAGKIDFDILLSNKAFMPKLTKFARVLGPKGLMPNPKRGTLTEDPEKKKKELESGAITIRTEKKAPLLHLTVGKVSMTKEQLTENIQALMKVVGTDLRKISISASMTPGIKIQTN